MTDITGPGVVELSVRDDGKVVWVDVDGRCELRACQIGEILIDDRRPADATPAKPKTITLELDDLDFDTVQQAMSRRQGFMGGNCLPDGGGNLAGRVVAEICRGWMEMLDVRRSDK
jgi:hypothetical protein